METFIRLLPMIIVLALYGWGGWLVARKAGLSPAWGLLAAIPIVQIVALFAFVLVRWPALDRTGNEESL